jgi:hypothetical protein
VLCSSARACARGGGGGGGRGLARSLRCKGKMPLVSRQFPLRFLSGIPDTRSDTSATPHTVQYQDPLISSSDGPIACGHYESISSQSEVARPYVSVKSLGTDLSPIKIGESVWIRGRVIAIRQKGKSCFMVIRSDTFYTVQTCHFVGSHEESDSKELLKFVSSLTLETIVDIQGTLASASVKSCTQDNIEIQMRKIYVVSTAPPVLPFLLEDAARPESVIAASQDTPRPFAAVAQVWIDVYVYCVYVLARMYGYMDI